MRGKKQTGQSIAELAFLLPMLMLILMGCLDLGRAFGLWMNLANVAREGARYGCLNPTYSADDIKLAVKLEIESEGLDYDALGWAVDIPEVAKQGHPIIVKTWYEMPLLTGFLFGGHPVRVSASTHMVIIEGVE